MESPLMGFHYPLSYKLNTRIYRPKDVYKRQMYRLELENFCVEFNPTIHENDLPFPVNTSLNIKVFSYGFSADAVMDIDVRGLADFAISLNRLYETLKGSAILETPYGVHRDVYKRQVLNECLLK